MANSANTTFGIDTDVSCASDASWLASNAGVCFVGRYYSAVDASKVLTPSEAQALSAAGLQIVTVYEDVAQSASNFSAALGQQNAITAVAQAIAVGQPAGSAIYFAVDYDAPSADIEGCIASYFSAVAAVLATKGYAVGVYGSGAVCAAMRAGCASYAWLSQSGGSVHGYSDVRGLGDPAVLHDVALGDERSERSAQRRSRLRTREFRRLYRADIVRFGRRGTVRAQG